MLSCGTFFLLLWLRGQNYFWISALLDNFPDAWKFEKHDSACLRPSELLSHCSALHNLESWVDIKILRQGMDINPRPPELNFLPDYDHSNLLFFGRDSIAFNLKIKSILENCDGIFNIFHIPNSYCYNSRLRAGEPINHALAKFDIVCFIDVSGYYSNIK